MGPDMVNAYDAKSHFLRLLARVEHGDEVVISRNGRPVARLVPYRPTQVARRPGMWKGRVTMPADFDDFSTREERDWYG
ncbi:type II toxin-antitoxin system prevent-host-death family antitoxin [Mycobacterium sp. AMU20-3851]|uniref:type II toxin-antitoxin system Phd/YefM family antitoxin n=1 Tax=Mycobacterium sp. AMU20-3851 TaxID=3122055 RepID=UPI0037546640